VGAASMFTDVGFVGGDETGEGKLHHKKGGKKPGRVVIPRTR